MTLLGFDGFQDGLLVPKPEWDTTTAWGSAQTGRSGDTNGAVACPNGSKTWTPPSAAATVIYGIAFDVINSNVLGNTGATAFHFGGMMVGGVVQCVVGTNASGFIEVRKGATWNAGTIIATSSGHTAIGTAAWHQVEVKGLMHTSTGQVIVKLDGVQVADTGVVATAATSGSVSAIRFGPGSGTANAFQYDDFYVCDAVDATGTQLRAYNDFLGDLKVITQVPNAAGDSTQWTPSTGSNFAAVDETPPNTTDFVSDSTSGHRDLYNLTDPPAGVATVYAVRESIYLNKTDAGLIQVKPVIKENATVTTDTAAALTVSFGGAFGTLKAVKPSGGLWTSTDLTNLQAGVEVA